MSTLSTGPLLENVREYGGVERLLASMGVVRNVFAAIQVDIQPIFRAVGNARAEVTMCDHNCTVAVDGVATGGHYTCPAALSLNRGSGRPVLAPTELVVDGLRNTITGLRHARGRFMSEVFPRYVAECAIPDVVAQQLRAAIDTDRLEVNLFGGSPESHPGYADIVEALHGLAVDVHLTTTGRRIIRDEAFREAFLQSPPELLGLGADDFDSPADTARLFSQSYVDMAREWQSVPWQHGQRRKAVEAAQIVRLSEEDGRFPPLLFNLVVHERNIEWITELLDVLTEHAPAAILNPYPSQTGFLGEHGSFTPDQVDLFSRFVDQMLDQHRSLARGQAARWNLVPRVQYWLMQRAALDVAPDAAAARDLVAGAGVWTCYRDPGAGRCVQIAAGGRPDAEQRYAGGHLGCFWNKETITAGGQVWDMSGDAVADWVLAGRVATGADARQPCQGCAFPRMSFDSISLELGLGPDVRGRYFDLRRELLGY